MDHTTVRHRKGSFPKRKHVFLLLLLSSLLLIIIHLYLLYFLTLYNSIYSDA